MPDKLSDLEKIAWRLHYLECYEGAKTWCDWYLLDKQEQQRYVTLAWKFVMENPK